MPAHVVAQSCCGIDHVNSWQLFGGNETWAGIGVVINRPYPGRAIATQCATVK
jgi:hypothetical protein